MHRKIKTHTAAQTAVDSISNAAAVCVCAQLFIWRKVFHVITSADGTESECTAFGRLITAGDKCLCLSAVCVPDAAVYAVGTAVFHSHSPLSSPTATHSSVPNTPARSVEVNTHTHLLHQNYRSEKRFLGTVFLCFISTRRNSKNLIKL